MRREKKTQADTVLKFRDRWVASAKVPVDYPGTRIDYWDTKRRGLGLRVDISGYKVWCILYRHGGVKRRLVLGAYQIIVMGEDGLLAERAGMSLAEARKQANIAFGKLAQGIDPAGEKAAAEAPAVDGDTFEKLAGLYIQACRETKREGTWKEYARTINHDLMPAWGGRIAKDISRADVKAVVAAVRGRGAATMANRLIVVISGFFSWCIKEELLTVHPSRRLDQTKEHPRQVTLSDDEIRALWRALDGEGFQVSAYFKLCLLTAQRRSEILSMRWSELDLKTGTWTIPPERIGNKSKKQHKVPLAPQAFEIIQALRSTAPEGCDPVFTGVGDVDNWIEKFRKAGLNARPHDLRTTASTVMTGNGVSEEDVGRILNHTQGGVTGRHYNMYPYQKEKLAGLRKLDNAIKRIVEGRDRPADKVVELRAS